MLYCTCSYSQMQPRKVMLIQIGAKSSCFLLSVFIVYHFLTSYKTAKKCPICWAPQQYLHELGKKSVSQIWADKFQLTWLRCSYCGHAFVWPYLSDKNLSDIYSTSYSAQASVEGAKLRGDSQFKMLQQLGLITSDSSNLRVLEQGCAHGAFLRHFAKFSERMFCLEPDFDVEAELVTDQDRKKLTLIRSVQVDDSIVADNSIDFWLGSHVIEHFADPNRFISSAYRKLKFGGIFFQEFPHERRLPANDLVKDYHLNYFSGKSIHVALTTHGFCQTGIFKVMKGEKFKGPEFWPDVSVREIYKKVELEESSAVLRVVYHKCKKEKLGNR